MGRVKFGENLARGTKLALFSDDKPDRIVTIVARLQDTPLRAAAGDPRVWVQFLVEDEELRRHLLLTGPDAEEWLLWRRDYTGLDTKSIYSGALIVD